MAVTRTLLLALCTGFSGIASLNAQNLPHIVTEPWIEGNHWAETYDDVVVLEQAHTKGGNQDVNLWIWDSNGRVRANRHKPDPSVVLGYRILSYDGNSPVNALDGSFWDLALVGGSKLADTENDWKLHALVGIGTANDGNFDNTDALYALGLFNASKQISEDASFHVGVQYQGNQVLFPEYPLPYAAWQQVVNERLQFTAGLPRSSFAWEAWGPFRIEAQYDWPTRGEARLFIEIVRNFSLFARYTHMTDAFHIDDRERKRLIYDSHRAGGGVRWITKWFDASLGIGYAFHQEFSTGTDIRQTRTVADLSDEPFASLRVVGTF